jgi:hypothetical protein
VGPERWDAFAVRNIRLRPMFAWSIIWVNDGVERDLGVGGYAEESLVGEYGRGLKLTDDEITPDQAEQPDSGYTSRGIMI